MTLFLTVSDKSILKSIDKDNQRLSGSQAKTWGPKSRVTALNCKDAGALADLSASSAASLGILLSSNAGEITNDANLTAISVSGLSKLNSKLCYESFLQVQGDGGKNNFELFWIDIFARDELTG